MSDSDSTRTIIAMHQITAVGIPFGFLWWKFRSNGFYWVFTQTMRILSFKGPIGLTERLCVCVSTLKPPIQLWNMLYNLFGLYKMFERVGRLKKSIRTTLIFCDIKVFVSVNCLQCLHYSCAGASRLTFCYLYFSLLFSTTCLSKCCTNCHNVSTFKKFET